MTASEAAANGYASSASNGNVPSNHAKGRLTDIAFGANVLPGLATMKMRLPKEVFKSVKKTIEDRARALDPKIADVVASAMKDLGALEGRHALRSRLLSAHRTHRREAR